MIRDGLTRVPGWEHPSAVIARTAIVTSGRSLRDNTRQLASVVLMGVFVVQMQFALFVPTMDVGAALVGSDPPTGRIAGILATVAGVGAYTGAHQVSKGSGSTTLGPLLRTSASPRTVVLGDCLADYLKLLGLLAGFAFALLVALGVGATNPLVPLALTVGALPLAWGGLLVGRAAGMAIRSAYRRIPGARAVSIVVVGAAFLVGFVWWMQIVQAERIGDVAARGVALASVGPLEAYVRTLLAPIGVPVAPIDAAISVGVLIVVVATSAIVVRIEAARDARERPDGQTGAGTRAVPTAIRSRPSLRIGWRYLLLGIRDPARFSHLSVLLIGFASAGAPALTNPGLAIEFAPEAGLVLGTALAGAAYCLNPLGDDRDQHPLLLTGAPTLRPVLLGRGVAGIALGAVALVLGLGVGLVDGRGPAVVGYLALAPVLFAASVGTALGFGAAVPSYDPTSDGGRIQPSTFPTMVHLFGSVLFGAIGAWLVVVTVAGVPLAPLVVGWLLFLATLSASGYLGYRSAVRRADALTLDAY